MVYTAIKVRDCPEPLYEGTTVKKMPEIDQLVVLNHELDATMYRVKECGTQEVGVIDATIEDARPNQRVQWLDLSLVMAPSNGQLSAFNL